MLTVLLTRHGHTVRSDPEQYLGQSVVAELSRVGRRQARALSRRLADVRIDRIISSPLLRARETAEIVARGREVVFDDRLMELDYGAWEGLTTEEIERQFPGQLARYDADPSAFHVGGGEDGRQVVSRLRPLIEEVVAWGLAPGSDRTCLLVGHSSVNRLLLTMVLGVPIRDCRRRFRQDFANLTVLDWPNRASGAMLILDNDVSHIHGSKGDTWTLGRER